MALIKIDNGVIKLAIDTTTKRLHVVSSIGGKTTNIKEIVFS